MAIKHRLILARQLTPRIRRLAGRCLSEEDKRLHIKWSFWLTLGAHLFWPPLLAVSLVFFIGLGKECWDQFYGSGFCLLDMASNMAGIAAGTLLCAIVLHGILA